MASVDHPTKKQPPLFLQLLPHEIVYRICNCYLDGKSIWSLALMADRDDWSAMLQMIAVITSERLHEIAMRINGHDDNDDVASATPHKIPRDHTLGTITNLKDSSSDSFVVRWIDHLCRKTNNDEFRYLLSCPRKVRPPKTMKILLEHTKFLDLLHYEVDRCQLSNPAGRGCGSFGWPLWTGTIETMTRKQKVVRARVIIATPISNDYAEAFTYTVGQEQHPQNPSLDDSVSLVKTDNLLWGHVLRIQQRRILCGHLYGFEQQDNRILYDLAAEMKDNLLVGFFTVRGSDGAGMWSCHQNQLLRNVLIVEKSQAPHIVGRTDPECCGCLGRQPPTDAASARSALVCYWAEPSLPDDGNRFYPYGHSRSERLGAHMVHVVSALEKLSKISYDVFASRS